MIEQRRFPGFENLSIQPLQNNFLSYLKAQGLSKKEISETLKSLKMRLKIREEASEYYAIMFAIGTITAVTRYSNREERKLECYYHYKNLEDSNLKRSEKVKLIAKRMGVKKDCIQVYLREIFFSPKN